VKRVLFLAGVVVALCVATIVSYGSAQAADASSGLLATPSQEGVATGTLTVTVPFLDAWMGSGHADTTAEAFNHWNEEDPAEVPPECAKCHSSPGYQDFLGADGSAAGTVDAPAPIGTVVDCVACHNDVTLVKDSVTMPSGLVISGLGDESRCMECHQGRESKVSVDQSIADAAVADDDTPSDKLGFKNIHYFAAAATKYGTLAKGGYEYDGKAYDGMFAHVDGFTTCIDCHNSHTLEVKVEECKGCHEDVNTVDDLKNVRMAGSGVDYNGNGDTEEGIYYELAGLQDTLMQAIQAYANDVTGKAIVYDANAYPYFFLDANANGAVDEGEGKFDAWTPRLLKAAYNYQTSVKDPGAFAHGGKYIIQLLYDSIDDLNTKLAEPIDTTALNRNDSGHFAGSAEAFRHWDAEGVVPGSCAKCHSAGGLPQFIQEGAVVSQHPANGFQCSTCHNDLKEFTRYEAKDVKFPSGAVIDSGDPDTNLCMTCHQGRESTVSVNKLISDTGDDAQSESLRFLNPHYFAAGATRYGTEAKGAYEYADKTYVGYFQHGGDDGPNNCTDCHVTHTQEVDWESCTECHEEVTAKEDLQNIRYNLTDYDGNGDDSEGIYFEIQSMRDTLLAAMQKYATDTVGSGIVYSDASYPYFFVDTNGNGTADPEEVNSDNAFTTWTPRLLRAAYNYQYSGKDPGSFAHNGQYIIQTVYDSIENIGGDVSGMTRPESE
jgi:hypothetical protein